MKKLTKNGFAKKVLGRKGACVVKFTAEWCAPCQVLQPILEDLALEFPDVDFYKVDIDAEAELANQYGITSIPTVLIFNDTKLIKRIAGLKPISQYKQILKKI